MSRQVNLDSFFKVPKEKRVTTTIQTKLSFATKTTTTASSSSKPSKTTTASSSSSSSKTKPKHEKKNDKHEQEQQQQQKKKGGGVVVLNNATKDKENTKNHHGNDDLMDTDDDDENEADYNSSAHKLQSQSSLRGPQRKRSSDDNDDDDDDNNNDDDSARRKKRTKRTTTTRTKRVIDDDDSEEDDDEEEFQPKHEEEVQEDDDHDEDDVIPTEEESLQDDEKPETTTTDSGKKKPSVNDVLISRTSFKSKTTTGGKKKSELAADNIKSDGDLLLADDNNNDDEIITWKNGDHVPYGAVCSVMEQIEAITSRLHIQQLLTDLFRKVLLKQRPEDMYQLIYLVSNTVAPAYECVELGIGDSILIKAIGEAYGTNPSIIKQKYKAEGDLGSVAGSSKGKQRTLVGFGAKPKPLLAKDVLSVFRDIASTSGSQSQKQKVDMIKKLLVRAGGGPEAKFIIRGLQGKLRIGLAQSTVLISLAHAVTLTPPEAVRTRSSEKAKALPDDDAPQEATVYANPKTPLDKRLEAAVAIMKKAYSEVPSYDAILDAALSVPLQEMYMACTLKPGLPVTPMLAKPTKSIQEVLKRLNGLRFTCEFKYDGERAQVHMTSDGTTKVFSRSLLDTSEKFPEVPLYVKEACADTGVQSFVLDTEVVGFDRETGQFVPFQVLSTRKKTEESAETAKVQVIVQAFDLMYLNGKSLLNATLAERRELLKKNFKPIDGKFQFATSLDHKEDGDTTVLEEFLDTAVKTKCEGLMVKTLDVNAAYEPSRRSLNWLKLKKDYLEGLGDSVDLVPLGAYHGRGKRTGVYGAYLLACYDDETEEFQSVCKIGTGFSEEDLKARTESLKEHIIPEKSSQYNVSDALECDVWFDAVQVWEVKAADLSKSSAHRGAVGRVGEPERGIGLRFPRFERARSDKRPVEATSSEQILEMYYQQDSVAGGADDVDDDDGI